LHRSAAESVALKIAAGLRNVLVYMRLGDTAFARRNRSFAEHLGNHRLHPACVFAYR